MKEDSLAPVASAITLTGDPLSLFETQAKEYQDEVLCCPRARRFLASGWCHRWRLRNPVDGGRGLLDRGEERERQGVVQLRLQPGHQERHSRLGISKMMHKIYKTLFFATLSILLWVGSVILSFFGGM